MSMHKNHSTFGTKQHYKSFSNQWLHEKLCILFSWTQCFKMNEFDLKEGWSLFGVKGIPSTLFVS